MMCWTLLSYNKIQLLHYLIMYIKIYKRFSKQQLFIKLLYSLIGIREIQCCVKRDICQWNRDLMKISALSLMPFKWIKVVNSLRAKKGSLPHKLNSLDKCCKLSTDLQRRFFPQNLDNISRKFSSRKTQWEPFM